MFWGKHVPIISRKLLYVCDTVICHYEWRLVCWLDVEPNQQTGRYPYRVTNTSVA